MDFIAEYLVIEMFQTWEGFQLPWTGICHIYVEDLYD